MEQTKASVGSIFWRTLAYYDISCTIDENNTLTALEIIGAADKWNDTELILTLQSANPVRLAGIAKFSLQFHNQILMPSTLTQLGRYCF